MNIWRKKPISITGMELSQDQENGHLNEGTRKLQKSLGAFDLALLGIGAIIGTGIFVLTGVAAARHAGPGLVLSFIMAGIACAFAALCYSEFASTVPAAGSAYTYSYAAFGEIIAWILGWDLILEYGVAASAVAVGWSGYVQGLLEGFGWRLPVAFRGAYDPSLGRLFDLPAILIVLFIAWLLNRGIRKTAQFNTAMVFIKLTVVVLFIAVGAWYVKPENWTPFLPFGYEGAVTGAATVFFAYIGFDSVSTAAEEVRRPQRDLPIGIITSLVVCTILYIVVSLILTGIVPYSQLDVSDPVAFALRFIGLNKVAGIISLGAVTGITTVLLMMMYGQSRLFYAMSKDGLLPSVLSRVNPRTSSPSVSTWIIAGVVAFFAGILPLGRLAELTNIGTLFAFAVVSLGIVVLRRTQPDLRRGFRVPMSPWIPLLSVGSCLYLMLQLPAFTWAAFLSWLVIGLFIYSLYGYRHSRIR